MGHVMNLKSSAEALEKMIIYIAAAGPLNDIKEVQRRRYHFLGQHELVYGRKSDVGYTAFYKSINPIVGGVPFLDRAIVATFRELKKGIGVQDTAISKFLRNERGTSPPIRRTAEVNAMALEVLRRVAPHFGSASKAPTKPNPETLMVAQLSAPSKSTKKWLEFALNIVLEGVPGTGKTHAVQTVANTKLRTSGTSPRHLKEVAIRFMTMHPSTSYEDFVEGLRPAGAWSNATCTKSVSDGKAAGPLTGPWFFEKSKPITAAFALKNGFFVEACVAAVADPNKAVVVVLDELNRCNIPKVLGDLMTVMEESKRAQWNGMTWVLNGETQAVTLPYSGRKLFVPDNLFIVGTMNTTDRSVAPMDAALRRRFAFHRVWPQGFGPDAATTALELQKRLGNAPDMTRSLVLWKAINTQLLAKYGADAMLGHSYLDDLRAALERDPKQTPEVVAYHWNHRILPQLMDVIASNGLTRSLVEDPKAFFGNDARILAGIDIAVAGSGSLRTAELRYRAS